jgi:peroxiredoxin
MSSRRGKGTDERLRDEQGAPHVLTVGTPAPEFTLRDQNQQPVSLSDFRDRKSVLLVFFPLAFTGICQGELDEIRDHLPDYENDDVQTLAISVGPPPTHKIWATENGFTFPVLSDFWPHGQVAQTYGVFNDDAGFANRGTFLVDRSGVIRFAEMNGPGEARDQGVWKSALAALPS